MVEILPRFTQDLIPFKWLDWADGIYGFLQDINEDEYWNQILSYIKSKGYPAVFVSSKTDYIVPPQKYFGMAENLDCQLLQTSGTTGSNVVISFNMLIQKNASFKKRKVT